MIDKKERKALNEMWGSKDAKAKADGMITIPDGDYQIKILNAEFKMSAAGKPQFVTALKVVGGEEEYIGETFPDYDNMETGENMGWFKSKLAKLGIDFENDDMDFVLDGKCAKKMKGLVFAGKVVTKGSYTNLYVQSLVSEADDSDESSYDEEAMPEMDDVKFKDDAEEIDEDDEEEIDETPEIEEDDIVSWTSKGKMVKGVILEILADDEKAIVEKEDGKKAKVKLSSLSIIYESDTADDEEEIEEEETDESYDDKMEKIRKMQKGEIADKLEEYNLSGDTKKGKSILSVLCAVEEEQKLSKDDLKLACKAYGIVVKSGDKISKITQLIRAEIDAAQM